MPPRTTSGTEANPSINNENFYKNPSGGFVNVAFADPSLKGTKIYSAEEAGIGNPRIQAGSLLSQQKSPVSSVVSSSAPIIQQENRIKSNVASLSNPVDSVNAATAASNNYLAQLDAQLQSLKARGESEVGGITETYRGLETQLKRKQEEETGATTTGLARIGGYLGGTASGQGAMINLGVQHKNELLQLYSRRDAAIQEARNAVQDKEFSIAALKAKEAKDVESEIQNRKDKYFQQNLDLMNAQRQQDKDLRDKYTDELKILAAGDPTTIPPEKIQEIDDFYGVPGFAKRYIDVTAASAKAKNEQEVLDSRQKLLNLIQDIPAGQKVKFPDGTEYTGIGKTEDISTSLQVDSNGVGRIVAYNKGTGRVTTTNVGVVGKASGDSGSVPPAQRDSALSLFNKTMQENKLSTGKLDPDKYIAERNKLKEAFPQLVKDLDNQYLGQGQLFFNTKDLDRLRKAGIYVTSTQ